MELKISVVIGVASLLLLAVGTQEDTLSSCHLSLLEIFGEMHLIICNPRNKNLASEDSRRPLVEILNDSIDFQNCSNTS